MRLKRELAILKQQHPIGMLRDRRLLGTIGQRLPVNAIIYVYRQSGNRSLLARDLPAVHQSPVFFFSFE